MVCGLPPGNRHVRGKGGKVDRNEGTHSRLRDRLQRKAKGYSRSVAMPGDFITLIYLKLGIT